MLQSLLVIDDSEMDQYIVQRALKKWGFGGPLFQERDGLGGINFLKSHRENPTAWGDGFPPTVILLDINMPRMNGFEFLEEFQELLNTHEGLNSSVIMMFSSSELPADKERALKYPFVHGYISKPLTKEDIQSIAESLTSYKPQAVQTSG